MQTISLIQCSASKDIAEYITKERNLTVDLAIKSTHITDLIKISSEKDVLKAITGAIIMASEYFNVKGEMSEFQAVQTASLFIEQFPLETFEDLLICLKNAKIGKYGPIYNRIDGQMIFSWFRSYLDEKYERFEQIKRSEQIERQKETDEVFLPILKEALQEVENRQIDKPQRISFEKHFIQFSEAVMLFTKDELEESLEYYRKQESMNINSQFSKYIELLETALKQK